LLRIFMPSIKKLIEMEQLSILYRDIIRKNNFFHLIITLNMLQNIIGL